MVTKRYAHILDEDRCRLLMRWSNPELLKMALESILLAKLTGAEHYRFDRQISAHAALKPLQIRKYSLHASPCLSKNLLRQNCAASLSSIFRGIFGFLW